MHWNRRLRFARLGGVSKGHWRGAIHTAKRRWPLRPEGGRIGGGCSVSECGVRPRRVVVGAPGGNDGPGVSHREEQVLVEAFIPHAPLEALGHGVLGRLSWRDGAPIELHLPGEGQHGRGRELRTIVADDSPRSAVQPGRGCSRRSTTH